MSSHSELLYERFSLQLCSNWQEWFDDYATRLELPGLLRNPVSVEELCSDNPASIWPGFMLPDSLPLLSNEYGDWICGRVGEDDTLAELVYWYHGGGDWIPVGRRMAEAVLHDAVDQFRDLKTQMLRGASESRIGVEAGCLLRLDSPAVRRWLSESLAEQVAESDVLVASVIQALSDEDYHGALNKLWECGVACEAVACDLIDVFLQAPLRRIATREVADACSIPWFPDFVSLLFDVAAASETHIRLLENQLNPASLQNGEVGSLQGWDEAALIADSILERRTDLGWATTISGWYRERSGRLDEAIAVYIRGVSASSFTDQAVRLNSHAEADELGKFALARLASLHGKGGLLGKLEASDGYTQLLMADRKRSLLAEVSDYWWSMAEAAESESRFADAYDMYARCGWDMGVSRLDSYPRILESLARVAEKAGWAARAAVAQAHLRRMP